MKEMEKVKTYMAKTPDITSVNTGGGVPYFKLY